MLAFPLDQFSGSISQGWTCPRQSGVRRQGLFILSSFPPLVIPAQAGIYIVLPRESCHRPL